jgi:signal transduction histidine kinase
MEAPDRQILLIEDNPGDARLIVEMLREVDRAPGRLEWVGTLGAGLARLAAESADVILLDLSLPDSQGLATFAAVHQRFPETPVVVLSGLADEQVALTAVREGAQDYLVKGQVEGATLVRALAYAIERKRIEGENAKLYRQAQEAIHLRDTVLSSVTHDLRNPLAAVRIIADTLRLQIETEGAESLAAVLEGLDRIDANARKMSAQIDELLDVARLQTGRQLRLTLANVDVVQLATSLVAEHQERTIRHRLRLEAEVPALVGRWDGSRLERVLSNLLSNAIKYSPGGGDVVVRIRQEQQADEPWAIISVQDSGEGIPAAERSRLFSWFYRGSNVADRIAGAGIGLAGAREIVLMHRGRITVESAEGHGSTFTVFLPLTRPSDRLAFSEGDPSEAPPPAL